MKKVLLFSFALMGLLGNVLHAQLLEQKRPQFWRPYDKHGVNVYEPSRADTVAYKGAFVRIGGNFTQQFQALNHSNDATPGYNSDGVNTNKLKAIGPGFNLATANLNIDAQLDDGIRLSLITYLSSRHHPETWVKGGYLRFDKLPFLNSAGIDSLMDHFTLKIGHMEVNYGDAHFYRTDNGDAFHNPFVGNYILDAFTTEIGAELYYQCEGWLAMAAITGGEIGGDVVKPAQRTPSLYGKVGYDKQMTEKFRLRLTGSAYHTASSLHNTLFYGDRTGSRYYSVMTNTLNSNFTSGRVNPVFSDQLTTFTINPFVKYGGLELFGKFEQASGRTAGESDARTWNQIGANLVYRFGEEDNFYVGGRYNTASGTLPGTGQSSGMGDEVTINRVQAGGGWFITDNILAKVEYVRQQYQDYPETNILHKGAFSGLIAEGSVAF